MNTLTSKRLRGLCLALALFLLHAPAVAQTGKIVGTVVDAETGDPLLSATVNIEGTTIGAATDLDGNYELANVAPGAYNLVFRYISYNTKVVQGVDVKAGETTRLDVTMSEEAVGLDEIVVEVEAATNSEGALLRVRQRASAVSDAISAEAISRSGSSDAADAMAKVTGASVQDGRYVSVRGLGDRYASTQINGVRMPSADPDRNAVQFDLMPAGLLDNIVTLKTFTPDKPGNFSGGLIDINTKNFPDHLLVKFSTSVSANTEAHFGDQFLLYSGGELGFLGIDGSFDIPEPLRDPNVIIPERLDARSNAGLADTLNQYSQAFNGIMAPAFSADAPLNRSYALSVGNKVGLFGGQLGFLGSLTYSRGASFRDGFAGRYSVTEGASEMITDLAASDVRGKEEASLGGLLNVAYRPVPSQEIAANVFFTRVAESQARYQEGLYPGASSANDSTTFLQNRVLTYAERDLVSGQLRGEHAFGNRARFAWVASLGTTRQDEPDRRLFANTLRRVSDGNGGLDTLYGATGSGIQEPSRYFRTMEENNLDYKADLSFSFNQWGGLKSELKVGGAFTRIERTFRERLFQLAAETAYIDPYAGDPDAYFSDDNTGIVRVDTSRRTGRVTYRFGHYLKTRTTDPFNNYDGDQSITAGYLMLELPIVRTLKLIGGARIEQTDLEVLSQAAIQEDGTVLKDSTNFGQIKETDVLPSLNLVYNLTDNMNLRLAATRTLARPTFREFAPFSNTDIILSNLVIGNPSLKRTLITNYDFRWEWFTRPGEILAASVFYKRLDNPIELTLIGGTNGQRKFDNVDEATVLGLELELRKRLDQVLPWLKHVSLGGNASFINSRINIGENELRIKQALDSTASDTRELQGQSPFTLNLDLAYENYETGTSIGLYYNVFGRRLSVVSLGATPDVFERPRPQLDFTASQQFRSVTVKVSAKNLLNSAYRETYRYQGQDFDYYRYETGRTFSLSLSYTL